MSSTTPPRSGPRRTLGLTGAAVTAALVAATPALAGSTTTALPNGADLTVTVDSPVAGDMLVVPAGSTVDVPLSGTASVPNGRRACPGSTSSTCPGEHAQRLCGLTTVLTCEKDAVVGLNDLVVTDGSAIDVGVAIFAGDSETADISSAAGDQLALPPTRTSTRPSARSRATASRSSRPVGRRRHELPRACRRPTPSPGRDRHDDERRVPLRRLLDRRWVAARSRPPWPPRRRSTRSPSGRGRRSGRHAAGT